MALIDCSECGAKISSMATSCPQCGNPVLAAVEEQKTASAEKKHGAFYYLIWTIVSVIALFVGSAIIAGIVQAQKARDIANDPNAIHSEDVVSLYDAAYACEYESRFNQALQHYNLKELTAWAQIVNDEPYCFDAHILKQGQKWTVLQTRGELMQVTPEGISDPKRFGHNYWTLTSWGTK